MFIKKNFSMLPIILLGTMFFISPLKAQVAIGENKDPEAFSLLELISETGGLRLPQLTTGERNNLKLEALDPIANKEEWDAAKGLVIFNTDTRCLEFWNSTQWVSLCDLDEGILISSSNSPSINTETFTFTPPGPVSNVRFSYVDDLDGQVILELTPDGDYSGKNISAPCTAKLVYRSHHNSKINRSSSNIDSDKAAPISVYVIYNENADGSGGPTADKMVKLSGSSNEN